MKKLLTIILMIQIFCISGCILDSGSNSPGDMNAEDYYPLKTGNSWVYKMRLKNVLEGFDEYSGNYSSTISNSLNLLIKTIYYADYSYDLSDQTIGGTQSITILDNKIHIYPDIISEKKAGLYIDIPVPTDMIISDTALHLDFSKEIGESWALLSAPGQTRTGMFLGEETVEVPLGTYGNCAKFEIQHFIPGDVVDTTIQTHYWLAQSVGIVKFDRKISFSSKDTTGADITTSSSITFELREFLSP